MKSFKHVISYACDKNCSYCINELLTHEEKQCKDITRVAQKYEEMALAGYKHIMLSGGEPVINKMFHPCLYFARELFEFVTIISAHDSILMDTEVDKYADDVLFSFHNEYLDNWQNKVVYLHNAKFYASMIVETYLEMRNVSSEPLDDLKLLGFKGATLRQCYPDGVGLPDDLFPPKDFSFRYYSNNHCVEDSVMLLPDLSLSTQKEFAEI